MTQIVFNEEEPGKRYQSLQSRLKNLGEANFHIFILANYDCCRFRKDRPKNAAGVIVRSPFDQEEAEESKHQQAQMFSVFSCAAGGRTNADSKLAAYLLKEARQQIKDTNQFTTPDGDILRMNVPGSEVL